MAVNLVSPGIKIREVDLTIGRIDQSNNQVGAFAGPFQKGPVDLPVLIQTELDLIRVFGEPKADNDQNLYWLSASNYLSYGGVLQVVRSDSSANGAMINAYAGVVGVGSTANVKIKSVQDYINKSADYFDTTSLTSFHFAAINPGSWANNLTVHVIDGAADQIISGINTASQEISSFTGIITNRTGSAVGGATSITGITTTGISLGQVVVCDTPNLLPENTTVIGIGSQIGIGTGTNFIYLSNAFSSTFQTTTTTFDFGSVGIATTGVDIEVGYGVKVQVANRGYAGVGTTESFSGFFKGIVTGVGNSAIDIKLISKYSNDSEYESDIRYSENDPLSSIQDGDVVTIYNPTGPVAIVTYSSFATKDWYNEQKITLGNSTVYWKNIAERPSSSQYALQSGGRNDEFNLIVVDNNGKINGNVGEILERHTKLSKAKDAKITPSQQIYYKDYLRDNSNYVLVGVDLEGVSSKFSSNLLNNYTQYSGGTWSKNASSTTFDVIGNKEYELLYGKDYANDTSENYGVELSDIVNAYSIFANPAEYSVDYLITGPTSTGSIFDSQAKANYLISIAESRKDCIAVVSAHESGVVNVASSDQQTSNIIKFFNGVSASTYAVFDAGYKYTYDRFNNQFVYLACNSDVAGLMARTSINQYPWYSPAGAARGVLNNAIKLAYNPSEAQRDLLYTNKINPIIASPGQGIILYGDKTASANVSAFDRINVRKLFLTLERTIESAARGQLFEFNDPITRSNFVNIIDPYLRDVKGKRGITEYLLICDDSNNTPDIIDSNQFIADIFVKPTRSINFIGLTFVATRTGVSFTEVVGTV